MLKRDVLDSAPPIDRALAPLLVDLTARLNSLRPEDLDEHERAVLRALLDDLLRLSSAER
jgi:hypothetical protein